MAVATPAPERAAARKRLAKAGKALSDGSYPIPNTAYLKKAIRSVGRAGPGKRPALAALIRKRAAQLGSSGRAVLKGSWADNKQSAKAMSNALRGQLLELGFTPEQAEFEAYATMPFMVCEFAGDGEANPDTTGTKNYVGNIHPKRKQALKKLMAKGVNPSLAYKMAQKVKVG